MEDRSSRRVRTLVTLTARRGLSANRIACALISMMARSTCSNRKPNTLTQDRINQRRPKPLAPRGRTIHLGHERRPLQQAVAYRFPLCPVSDQGLMAVQYVARGQKPNLADNQSTLPSVVVSSDNRVS